MRETLGLYLHIPFCVKKCNYCDFCSTRADAATRAAYVDALCAHLLAAAPTAKDRVVDTVYLGGGTPTILEGAELARILRTVRSAYALTTDVEITTECNPITGRDALFETLASEGVNRLSIGVQSVHENELALLGRAHSFADFLATLDAARRAGLSNISADVMFGIPAQTPESFKTTLETLVALPLTHLSAYGLRIEEGTPFAKHRDTLPFPSEDEEADMAELVATLLPKHGFSRYEISNYARNGAKSKHNMRYWLGEEYLGFGPAAHSFFGGVRFATPPDTSHYINAVASGNFDALRADTHIIAPPEAREEYIMLRMRLADGVDKQDFSHRFGTSFEDAYGDLTPLAANGLLVNTRERVAFTARGMQVSNAILAEWLDFKGE